MLDRIAIKWCIWKLFRIVLTLLYQNHATRMSCESGCKCAVKFKKIKRKAAIFN